ncbi:MAG: type IV pilus twitching motility protein PilT [Dissulfurispiraceae bacterium]
MDIETLLSLTKEHGASDLHISAGIPPTIRLHGMIKRLEMDPLTNNETHKMISDIMTDDQRARFERELELDFSISISGVSRFRVNAYQQERGESAAFRIVPSESPTLSQLNIPPIIAECALKERGLILVTGPTGSGKSTTLAAIVNHINENKYAHIITIEDPIEFLHTPKNCLINQREVGQHTHSFSAALRSALREDPDVILVGEMRDLETTSLAITAAETGHLVLATLHTNSAAKTVDRVIDIFPAESRDQVKTMFSESIVAIISQALLPRSDGKGRVAALEILIANAAVRNLIREGKTFMIPSVIQTGQQHGMQSLEQVLKELIHKGIVTREEAATKVVDVKSLADIRDISKDRRA